MVKKKVRNNKGQPGFFLANKLQFAMAYNGPNVTYLQVRHPDRDFNAPCALGRRLFGSSVWFDVVADAGADPAVAGVGTWLAILFSFFFSILFFPGLIQLKPGLCVGVPPNRYLPRYIATFNRACTNKAICIPA